MSESPTTSERAISATLTRLPPEVPSRGGARPAPPLGALWNAGLLALLGCLLLALLLVWLGM